LLRGDNLLTERDGVMNDDPLNNDNPDDILERTRRHINKLVEEIADLGTTLPPNIYYPAFLNRVLTALAAPAGAIWLNMPNEDDQLQDQVNLDYIFHDISSSALNQHRELLRHILQTGQALMVLPHDMLDRSPKEPAPRNAFLRLVHRLANAMKRSPAHIIEPAPKELPPAGNPTPYFIHVVPYFAGRKVAGLVEVFQDSDRNPNAQRGFFQFITRMAECLSANALRHAESA
jgi:hypothetical protein